MFYILSKILQLNQLAKQMFPSIFLAIFRDNLIKQTIFPSIFLSNFLGSLPNGLDRLNERAHGVKKNINNK
jgi:hypothetical protein